MVSEEREEKKINKLMKREKAKGVEEKMFMSFPFISCFGLIGNGCQNQKVSFQQPLLMLFDTRSKKEGCSGCQQISVCQRFFESRVRTSFQLVRPPFLTPGEILTHNNFVISFFILAIRPPKNNKMVDTLLPWRMSKQAHKCTYF